MDTICDNIREGAVCVVFEGALSSPVEVFSAESYDAIADKWSQMANMNTTKIVDHGLVIAKKNTLCY